MSRECVTSAQRRLREFVLRLIGPGVDGFAVVAQQRGRCAVAGVVSLRGQAVTHQRAIAVERRRFDFVHCVGTTDLGKEVAQMSGGMVAPAVFIEVRPSRECVQTAAIVPSVGEIGTRTPEASGANVGRKSWRAKSRLRRKDQRSAKSIQAVDRIGSRDEHDVGQCRFGDQVPADDVAKRRVETNAIEKYRNTLRRAEQRRS